MKLNRTGSVWNRNERNKINDNWDKLEGNVNNLQNEITDKVVAEIKDSAKLNWGTPVNSFSDLPSGAKNGDARFVRDTGKVYRYDGKKWVEIQQIDAGPVNEVDSRLSLQLAQKAKHIANVSMYNKIGLHKKPKGLLTIIDDDANKRLYDDLFPVLQELNVQITAAAVTNRIEIGSHTTISKEQYFEMQNSGLVEFISHGNKHINFHNSTLEEVEEDLRLSKEWLIKHGGNADHFVVPFGRDNDEIKELIRKYYKTNFKTFSTGWLIKPPLVSYSIRRSDFEVSIAEQKSRLDQAKATNSWLIINTHSGFANFDTEDFKEIINHAKSIGLDIVTVGEAFEHFGNILETSWNPSDDDYGVIDAYGKLHGLLDSSYYVIDATNVKFDTPVDYYKFKRGVTVCHFTASLASDYGWPSAGTLFTYYNSSTFAYQRFVPYNSINEVQRYWLGTEWGEFLSLRNETAKHVTNPTNITSNMVATEFDNGITLCHFTNSLAANNGFPNSGILETVKSSGSYAYQRLTKNSGDLSIKVRSWDGVRWGTWIETI